MWALGTVLGRFGVLVPLPPCSLARRSPSTLEGKAWWLPLTGLSWLPDMLGAIASGSNILSGTFPQAHLLLMSLNVAKCNLGQVKLDTMLVSGPPRGGLTGWPGVAAGAFRVLQFGL